MNLGLCGLDCNKCNSYKNNQCKGCCKMKGTSIYGYCEWYHCCKNKKLEHCGECNTFPCKELITALNEVGGLSAIDNLRNIKK